MKKMNQLTLFMALLGSFSAIAAESDRRVDRIKVMQVASKAIDETYVLNRDVNYRANPDAPLAEIECSTYFHRYELRYYPSVKGEPVVFFDFAEPIACWEAVKEIKRNYKKNATSCLISSADSRRGAYLKVADESECD